MFVSYHAQLLIFSGLQVILSRQYGSEGRFIFTSHTPGEHQICLHSNSSKFALFAGGMLVSSSSGLLKATMKFKLAFFFNGISQHVL